MGPRPTSLFVYVLAVVLGLFSGWVNQTVDDALLTALCVLAFTMFLGVWKKDQPWRWVLLVWAGVPAVLAYYHFVVRWPHDRGLRRAGERQYSAELLRDRARLHQLHGRSQRPQTGFVVAGDSHSSAGA